MATAGEGSNTTNDALAVLHKLEEKIWKKVDQFILTNPQFKIACKNAFSRLDRNSTGLVRGGLCVIATEYAFDELEDKLSSSGIKVTRPSDEEVQGFLKDVNANLDTELNLDEFEEFYAKVLKYGAVKFAQGFVRKYGIGILAGIVSVFFVKKGVRAIPVVGRAISPLLCLLPSLIVGPVLGVAAVYGHDNGDLLAAQKKLFGKEAKPQFKKG